MVLNRQEYCMGDKTGKEDDAGQMEYALPLFDNINDKTACR